MQKQLGLFLALFMCSGASAQSSGADAFETVVKPVIKQTCSVCHNATALTAGLDLARFLNQSGPEALKERDVWEKVASKLKAGEMPPPGMPRPPAEQLAAIPRWIDQQYASADANAKPDPGSVTNLFPADPKVGWSCGAE